MSTYGGMVGYGKTLKALILAAAILAPAITLAVLGLRAYRAEALLLRERSKQDQEAIVRLVAGRLSEAARKAVDDLEARASGAEPDATLEWRFRAAHPLARHILVVRRGRLVYPAVSATGAERGREHRPAGLGFGSLVSDLDVMNYVGRLRESRRQANLVSRGLRAEHRGQLERAHRLYLRASRGTTEPAARALLGLARVDRRQGNLLKARDHLTTLRQRFGGRQDTEGVSYALLADAGLFESGVTSLLPALHGRLLRGEYRCSEPVRHFYLRWVVEQMSADPRSDPKKVAELRRTTSHAFASERFGALLHRHGVLDLEQLATDHVSGVVLDRRNILVLRKRGETMVGYAVDETYLAERVARQQQEVPGRRGIRLSLQRVGDLPRQAKGRLLFALPLDPPLGHWTLATRVLEADPISVLDQRGGMRGLAVVVGLILALLVGLLLTYRGVRRESELAQLKSDFASNVSHELKTPLTSIRMYAEMLEHGIAATAEDQQRYHRVIIRESERLGRLIANVLDFSKVERGTRRYEIRPEDLAAMTQEALETFRRLAEGEQISIHCDTRAGLPKVNADREAAVQSILNLLSNAAKYSAQRPEIEVELRQQDGEVGVTVRDRGIGVPPAEQKRIFDDFYRAPNSRRLGVEGTGLGLALVRRHMKACGGRVELESEQGKGSSFTLWFPQSASQESEHGEDPDHRG